MNRIEIDVAGLAAAERSRRVLSYVELGWKALAGIFAILAGIYAASIALIAFGLVLVIEVLHRTTDLLQLAPEEREQRLVKKLFAGGYLIATVGVAFLGIKALTDHEHAINSYVGLAIAAVTLIIAALIYRERRRLAQDTRVLEIVIPTLLLLGLFLNAVSPWWWADPAAALALVLVLIYTGIQVLRLPGSLRK